MEMLVNTLNQLGLDSTFYYQFVVAIIGLPLVAYVLIKPLFENQIKREEATVGFREKTENLVGQAKDLEEKYEETLSSAHREAQTQVESLVSQGQEEARNVVSQARAESAKVIESIRARSQKEVNELKGQLQKETSTLVNDIVERLV